jgi:aminoglycoside phosphotransferase (APT) family kinase protein
LRGLHDAAADFRTDNDCWRHHDQRPAPGEIVSHGDVAPWNTVYRGGVPVAFIDWDPARPVEPLLELADAAWCFVPLDETRGAGRQDSRPRYGEGAVSGCSSTPMG